MTKNKIDISYFLAWATRQGYKVKIVATKQYNYSCCIIIDGEQRFNWADTIDEAIIKTLKTWRLYTRFLKESGDGR